MHVDRAHLILSKLKTFNFRFLFESFGSWNFFFRESKRCLVERKNEKRRIKEGMSVFCVNPIN